MSLPPAPSSKETYLTRLVGHNVEMRFKFSNQQYQNLFLNIIIAAPSHILRVFKETGHYAVTKYNFHCSLQFTAIVKLLSKAIGS